MHRREDKDKDKLEEEESSNAENEVNLSQHQLPINSNRRKTKQALLDHFHYNRAVFIDFVKNEASIRLKKRWDDKHPDHPCEMIDGNDFLTKDYPLLFDENDIVLIYIRAHTNPMSRSHVLGAGNGRRGSPIIKLEELAEKLTSFIDKQRVVVNLLGCGAARSKEDVSDDSFQSLAAHLHVILASKLNRDVPIVARMSDVQIDRNTGKKFTAPLNTPWGDGRNQKLINKQPGSKVVFSLNKNRDQVRYDVDWLMKDTHTKSNNFFARLFNTKSEMIAWMKDYKKSVSPYPPKILTGWTKEEEEEKTSGQNIRRKDKGS